jgi:ribosomal protein L16 Arg81 hydroxylase
MNSVAPQAFQLDDAWRRWVGENVLLGVGEQTIVDILVGQGMSPEQARAELEAARTDPYLDAGNWMAQRLRKLESALDAMQRMRRLDPANADVPRRSGMSRGEFLAGHYAANRPVILTDVAERWGALQAWTPDYLKRVAGSELVEVMTGRDTDKQYEVNLQAHRSRTRFADYVDRVTGSAQTNDFYLVANNHFLDNPGTAALWADFDCDQRFLDAAIAAGRVFFWFGPAGTITPLHHDVSNILLVQVRGTKRVTLVPAQESHLVYNDIAVYSQVDADSVDLQQYPRFGNATKLTVDLRPAEALFIPVGWWHHVRSLDICISLSFTNFAFPNEFDWSFPSIVR